MSSIGDIVHLKIHSNYKTPLLNKIVNTKHPVLVVDKPSPTMIRIAALSSNMKQVTNSRPYNVPIIDWKKVEIPKQTYVDVGTTGVVNEVDVYKKLTTVTKKDMNNVTAQLSKTKQRQVIEAYKIYNTGDPEYLDYYFDSKGNKIIMLLGD